MKLIEYDADLFLRRNKYNDSQKKKCILRGFILGVMAFFKADWLGSNNRYTPIDFINEVYELNLKVHEMTETELIESLARFLCGYDEAINFSQNNEIQNKSEQEQRNAFQNKQNNIDIEVTDNKINEKIKLIKGILNI